MCSSAAVMEKRRTDAIESILPFFKEKYQAVWVKLYCLALGEMTRSDGYGDDWMIECLKYYFNTAEGVKE